MTNETIEIISPDCFQKLAWKANRADGGNQFYMPTTFSPSKTEQIIDLARPDPLIHGNSHKLLGYVRR